MSSSYTNNRNKSLSVKKNLKKKIKNFLNHYKI